jgi:toluene monooxygenase system ferredoxin subunit
MQRKFVCRKSDIPPNGMKECEVEGGGLKVLVANSGDRYYAYQAICPHQEVALCEGMYDGKVLTCHQHLWQWDITTGAPMGLAEAPLEYYDVEVEGDSIYIASPSALKVAELFGGVAPDTLEKLSQLARPQSFDAGTVLYDVGDPVEDLYVLEAGRVNFQVGREERMSPAGFVLKKGEVFGWAALLDSQPRRIAKATCLDASRLLALNGREVVGVLEAEPVSGYCVMRRLCSLITKHLASDVPQ